MISVEKANSATATARTTSNHGRNVTKASEVRTTPSAVVAPVSATSCRAASQLSGRAMTIVSAVIVQMMTVSMNGSSNETKPSDTGCRVLTAECAMAAEPTPASFEKAARWNPMIRTPTAPPATPSGENAPLTMSPIAAGMAPALDTMTSRQAVM